MFDLIVVGGGYWGTGIAYEARRLGWDVLVIDSGDPRSGSRNASAICDPSAYKSKIFQPLWPPDWQKSELEESFNWLVARGGRVVEEAFWNRFAGTEPRKGTKCIYLEDNSTLLRLIGGRKMRDVVRFGDEREWGWNVVTEREGVGLATKRLVVAAGYKTDEVLKSLRVESVGQTVLPGRGIIAAGTPKLELPVTVMIRPYTKHTVREWNGSYRIGDTAEENFTEKRLEALREIGRETLGGYKEEEVVHGFRPVTDRFLVEKVAPNLVVATGGHRLGLGLTGLVAARALRCFR